MTGATSPLQDLGDPNSIPGDCGCGEPINAGTGNVYYEVTDYKTAGTNQLVLTRYYNSLAARVAARSRRCWGRTGARIMTGT